jgi:hypothetical protein
VLTILWLAINQEYALHSPIDPTTITTAQAVKILQKAMSFPSDNSSVFEKQCLPFYCDLVYEYTHDYET